MLATPIRQIHKLQETTEVFIYPWSNLFITSVMWYITKTTCVHNISKQQPVFYSSPHKILSKNCTTSPLMVRNKTSRGEEYSEELKKEPYFNVRKILSHCCIDMKRIIDMRRGEVLQEAKVPLHPHSPPIHSKQNLSQLFFDGARGEEDVQSS